MNLPFFWIAAYSVLGVAALFVIKPLRRGTTIDFGWVIGSVLIYLSYTSVVGVNAPFLPAELAFETHKFNWGGKALGIALWLVVLWIFLRSVNGFQPADAGFTLSQRPGSVTPAMGAVAVLLAVQGIVSYFGSQSTFDRQVLAFQATMPGLDEEPLFRGVLLYALSRGLVSAPYRAFGGSLSLSGVLLCLCFGVLHAGIVFPYGAFVTAFVATLTSIYALGLLWIRERTGSIVIPVVAHNLLNVSGQVIGQ